MAPKYFTFYHIGAILPPLPTLRGTTHSQIYEIEFPPHRTLVETTLFNN